MYARVCRSLGPAACSVGFLSQRQSNCESRPDHSDVLIVGAGFAGAACARELRMRGIRCRILEARGKVAGRTFSTHWHGGAVELGGHYVHHSQPFLWAEINRYHKEVEDNGAGDEDCVCKWEDGSGWRIGSSSELYDTIHNISKQFCMQASNIFRDRPWHALDNITEEIRQLDNLTAKQVLDGMKLPADQYMPLLAWWEGIACCPLQNASYLPLLGVWSSIVRDDFAAQCDSNARFALKEGTASLHEAILMDADVDAVHLFSEVARLESNGNGVVATTTDGEKYTASACVVTVPLNVLHTIEFEPPLSEQKRKAVADGQATCGFQNMLKVRARDGELQSFLAMSPNASGIQWMGTERQTDDGCWILITYGPQAKEFDIFDKERVEREVNRIISGMDKQGKSGMSCSSVEVLDMLGWDWVGDPYSQGTWTIHKPGWITSYREEMTRPHPALAQTSSAQASADRIFFAGDYLAKGWNGFMDGAIESGITTATQVARRLGAQATINYKDGRDGEFDTSIVRT